MKEGKFSVVIDGAKYSFSIQPTKNGNGNVKPEKPKPEKDN